VKQIRAFLRKDPSLAKKLAKEIRIWAKLNHDNVLPLLGYFTEGDNLMPALVSEWMEKGTLHDFMKSFPRCGIVACNMLRDIALGLAYLHSKEVIHADMKSHNVLISPSGTPLLADFGLSLALSQSQSTMGTTTASTKGTVRWMAIELFPTISGDPPSNHDEKSDVWAFGMVVYELLTWGVPYKSKRNDVAVMMAIVNGELPEKPEDDNKSRMFNALWELCCSCWQRNSESRPSARYIADHLIAQSLSWEDRLAEEERLQLRVPEVPSRTAVRPSIVYSRYSVYHKGRIWHMSPSALSPFDGHACLAHLMDDNFYFECESDIAGRIKAVELIHKGFSYASSNNPFEFTLTLLSNGTYTSRISVFSQFSVPDSNKACTWVTQLERIKNVTVYMQNATPDNMLGLVRRLATSESSSSLAFNDNAGDPTSSQRLNREHERRASGPRVAESSSAGGARARSRQASESVNPKRVRFIQDVTGEQPAEIPGAHWLLEEDWMPVRPVSPKRGRWEG